MILVRTVDSDEKVMRIKNWNSYLLNLFSLIFPIIANILLSDIVSWNNTIVRNCFLLLIFRSILNYLTKCRFKGNQLLEAATEGVL